MFKKEIYLQLGGYNSFFIKSQDIDLWLRFLQKKFKVGVCNLNEPLSFIRNHDEQITHKNDDDIFTSISILNFYCRNLNKSEISDLNLNDQLIIIDKIKKNKYYQSINLKNKIRFYKKNFFMWNFSNPLKVLQYIFSFKLIKYASIILMTDKKIYKYLANDIIFRNEF